MWAIFVGAPPDFKLGKGTSRTKMYITVYFSSYEVSDALCYTRNIIINLIINPLKRGRVFPIYGHDH